MSDPLNRCLHWECLRCGEWSHGRECDNRDECDALAELLEAEREHDADSRAVDHLQRLHEARHV
jgi:hypothetical protein